MCKTSSPYTQTNGYIQEGGIPGWYNEKTSLDWNLPNRDGKKSICLRWSPWRLSIGTSAIYSLQSIQECGNLQQDLDKLDNWSYQRLLKLVPNEDGKGETDQTLNNMWWETSYNELACEWDIGVDIMLNWFIENNKSVVREANHILVSVDITLQIMNKDNLKNAGITHASPVVEWASSTWSPHIMKHSCCRSYNGKRQQ